MAYMSLVRHIRSAHLVLDSYTLGNSYSEIVHKRASRYVKLNYDQRSKVNELPSTLHFITVSIIQLLITLNNFSLLNYVSTCHTLHSTDDVLQ